MKYLGLSVIVLLPAMTVWAAAKPAAPVQWEKVSASSAADAKFFATKIHPVLMKQCMGCHSGARARAGLSLDSRANLLKGGRHKVVVLGHPEQSLFIKAISYTDAHLKMPPMHKLTPQQIADMTHWVKIGVPWSAAKK